ncbi:MAG TPA: hypothetical protein VLD37_03190 [Candidatus Bilamarchaeum sp.]|nr:hypothetical protein [Candidatus Bilamarchaeum sp.]
MDSYLKRPRTPAESGQTRSAAKVFAAAALAGALSAQGCTDACPVNPACEPTHDYHMTLGVGECTQTVSAGTIVRVQVLDIYESIDTMNNRGFCYPQGGGARVWVRIESVPPFEQEFNIAPRNCMSIQQACLAISNVEVSEDLAMIPPVTDAGAGEAGGMDAGPPPGTTVDAHCKIPVPDRARLDSIVETGASGTCRITNERVSFTLSLSTHSVSIPDGGVVLDPDGAAGGTDY